MKFYKEAYELLNKAKEREVRQKIVEAIFSEEKLTEIIENLDDGNVLLGEGNQGPSLPFQRGDRYEFRKIFYWSKNYMLGVCTSGDGEIKLITLDRLGVVSCDGVSYFLNNK